MDENNVSSFIKDALSETVAKRGIDMQTPSFQRKMHGETWIKTEVFSECLDIYRTMENARVTTCFSEIFSESRSDAFPHVSFNLVNENNL